MTNQPTGEIEDPTPEAIAKRREAITTFYKESIKHLKVQKEYEELLRDIELARAERIQAQVALSQFYAKNNEAEEEFKKSKEDVTTG